MSENVLDLDRLAELAEQLQPRQVVGDIETAMLQTQDWTQFDTARFHDAKRLADVLQALPELVRIARRFRYVYGQMQYLLTPAYTSDTVTVQPLDESQEYERLWDDVDALSGDEPAKP